MINLLFLLAACKDQASFNPTADAGFDQLVALGGSASLDGSGSYDADGFVTTYSWSVVGAPDGSEAEAPGDSATGTFTPDLAGSYTLSLTVTDDEGNVSAPDIVTVTAQGANAAPEAVLSTSSTIAVGVPIVLDGSASFDPDGDALSYIFSVQVAPSGASPSLEHESEQNASAEFVADTPGTYVLGLEVDDGRTRSIRDDLTLVITEEANQPPVADCGPSQSVEVGTLVQVDGSASSDPEGAPLTYSWELAPPAGSAASLSDETESSPTFTTDVVGVFRAELTVSDGALESRCQVDVRSGMGENQAPVADGGSDGVAGLGEAITLDGRASYDPEGETLEATWQFVSQPSGSTLSAADIDGADTLEASFEPDVAGTWLIQLAVCDSEPLCDTDTVTWEVEGAAGNNPPVADAGSDVSGTLGDTLSADGSASSDPDGDALTYAWTLDSAPTSSALTTADLSGADTATPSITPDVGGTYSLSLEVCDTSAACDTDSMSISVSGGANTAPISDAGADQSVTLGDTVTVDGSGSSDPDGDPITYYWGFTSVPSGSSIAGADFGDRTAVSTTFTPDVAGTYTVRLRVDDPYEKDIDTMEVTVTGGSTNTVPVADAGDDQEICGTGLVSLDASGSTDDDGDTLTYKWVFISVPSGSALVNGDITDRKTATPSFTPDAEGTYSLRVYADDGTDFDTDRVDIEVGDSGAVLVLHMDETSGTTVSDSTWDGNDGTATNGDWLGARVFGGMEFDGSESVTVPDSSELQLTSDFTIEWWMKPDSNLRGTQTIFMKENSGRGYNYASYLAGATLTFYGLTGTGAYVYLYATPTIDGEWHHYAITYDSSFNGEIYEDGVAIGSSGGGSGAIGTSTGDLVIGDYSPSPGFYAFNGRMDEFIIHDSALTASEISDRYNDTEQFCSGDEDTDAPTATITSPATGTTASDGIIAIEGTASDDSEISSLTVGGATAVSTSGNFDTWVAYVALSDGSNSIEVDSEDIVGNVGTNVESISVAYSDDCYDDYSLFLAFDEDTGATATDYSPNGLDATESGTDRIIGEMGNAAVFDGSSYASITHDSTLSFSSAFTADFWYSRDGATSDIEVLFHKGVYNYAAALDGSDLYCLVRDTSGTDWTASASGYNDGTMHHVVCNYTGTKLRLYVDGVLEDIVTVGSDLNTNSSDLYIGSALGTSYFFEGQLDNLRFVESNFTGTELKALYTEGEVCTISDNLAPDGSASASSNLSANYTAANVIDEDTSEDAYADETYWLARTGSVGWVEVELADITGIGRIRWVNTHHGPRYSYAAKDYEIYASHTGEFNGEEQLIDSGTGDLETDLRYHQIDLSSPVTAQYVRFYVDSYYSVGGGVNEIEIFGVE